MENIANVSAIELGRHLTHVREQAGIKQADLARRVTWSSAVLSRIENGERELGHEELEAILDAIGTPAAAELRIALRRRWQVLPRPTLDHPDQDVLWSAEDAAQRLLDLRSQPEVGQAFGRRLSEYVQELKGTAALLLKRRPSDRLHRKHRNRQIDRHLQSGRPRSGPYQILRNWHPCSKRVPAVSPSVKSTCTKGRDTES